MTHKEFNDAIDNLTKVWPNSFPDGRLAAIWGIVKEQDQHWFKKVCNDFVIHNKAAPLPTDFLEAVRIRKISQPHVSFDHAKGSCGKCIDGIVHAEDKERRLFVFKCTCGVGNQRLERYPSWSNQWGFSIQEYR